MLLSLTFSCLLTSSILSPAALPVSRAIAWLLFLFLSPSVSPFLSPGACLESAILSHRLPLMMLLLRFPLSPLSLLLSHPLASRANRCAKRERDGEPERHRERAAVGHLALAAYIHPLIEHFAVRYFSFSPTRQTTISRIRVDCRRASPRK